MNRRILLATFVLLLTGFRGLAQDFDLERDREPIAELKGQWRFQTGDDPRWAEPGFDDSGWKLLSSDQPWGQQGYERYAGFAWYRFSVHLPDGIQEAALYLASISNSYQVFADGKLAGGYGGVPPRERFYWPQPQVIRLPKKVAGGRDLSVAIRVWRSRSSGYFGGPSGPSFIGVAADIQARSRASDLATYWEQSSGAYLLLLYSMVGLGSLLLYLLRRNEREYLWFAVYELASATFWAFRLWPAVYSLPAFAINTLYPCLFTIANVTIVLFLVALLKVRRGMAITVSVASAAVVGLTYLPLVYLHLPSGVADQLSPWLNRINSLGDTGIFGGALYVLFKAARRRVPDARLLLIPLSLFWGIQMLADDLQIVASFGVTSILPYYSLLNRSVDWPFPIAFREFAEFLTQVAILAILTFRFARSRRDEERLATEIEAARVVQQVLVPEEFSAIPGFEIHSVYKPAGQVGGDFFQIIPLSFGGVLMTIGDVSGKGIPAAMTVSLLVGTFRTLAHYTQSPSEILSAMNQRMLARSCGGFTTCLVLRADSDGSLTVANAGHISPYLNGEEVEVGSGLPLGLAEGSIYAERVIQLPLDSQLTVLTDGVVEARKVDGELFGFERTASISAKPVGEIATVAQAFGQDDDITVLSLTRR